MNNEFEYSGDDVLEVMSRFAINRNNTIEKLITQHFDLKNISGEKNLLEFGAGKGEFINRFKKYKNLSTFAVDLDDNYFKLLSRNHYAFQRLEDLPQRVDFIYAIDVLEHIEDDLEALKSMHAALQNQGKILIYVPARPELYSAFDKRIGHFRRYTLEELKNKTLTAGFKIQCLKYHDFLGYFAAYYNKFFFKDTGQLNAKAVKLYDRLLVPGSNLIEKVIKSPFIGKDILLIAYK